MLEPFVIATVVIGVLVQTPLLTERNLAFAPVELLLRVTVVSAVTLAALPPASALWIVSTGELVPAGNDGAAERYLSSTG